MRPEDIVQRSVIKYLGSRGYRCAFVPNGAVLAGNGQQRAKQMSVLKANGLCVGFPDLVIIGRHGRVGFMEIKAEGGTLQPSQKAVRDWMAHDAQNYAVVRSIDDAKLALERWQWP